MERLTNKREADAQREEYERRLANGYPRNIPEERFLRLAAYEDTGLEPELVRETAELAIWVHDNGIEKIKKWIKADKDGRVVVLPCKVGDTVWVTRNPWTGKLLKKPLDAYANGMKMYSHGLYVNLLFDTRKINGTRDYEINHIGKTVFLTYEEAEKALEVTKDV